MKIKQLDITVQSFLKCILKGIKIAIGIIHMYYVCEVANKTNIVAG